MGLTASKHKIEDGIDSAYTKIDLDKTEQEQLPDTKCRQTLAVCKVEYDSGPI